VVRLAQDPAQLDALTYISNVRVLDSVTRELPRRQGEFLLYNIQNSSSYLTGNTLRLRCKDQRVNARGIDTNN
jgi:hypothetical protein